MRPVQRRSWILVAALAAGVSSCQGCPSDSTHYIAHDFGTLNPLFDAARFADFSGAVVDPSPHVRKRFAVDLVLPVVASSIDATAVEAFALPVGTLGDQTNPPPNLNDNPEPLATIRVTHVQKVLRAGHVVQLLADLDTSDVQANAGRELLVQLDASRFVFAGAVTDDVFNKPMRFAFFISPHGADHTPPYIAGIDAYAQTPLTSVASIFPAPTTDALTVFPHSPIRFRFSEPLWNAAPLISPEDPVGFQPRPPSKDGMGISTLLTQTDAGLVPATDYCVTFVPPRMANVAAVGLGTQDLSGEALVPAVASAAQRRLLGSAGAAAQTCFRTGPVRIESPRSNDAIGFAGVSTLPLRFFAASECPAGADCSTVSYVVSAKLDDGLLDANSGWTIVQTAHVGDPGVQVLHKQGLQQGEIFVPGDEIIVPAILTGFGGAFFGGACLLNTCHVVLRVDPCFGSASPFCLHGDGIPITMDGSAPPAPTNVIIQDTDTADRVIDQVCVDETSPEPSEAVTVDVSFGSCDHPCGDGTVTLPTGDATTTTTLPSGAVRRCWTNVSMPPAPPLCPPGAQPACAKVERVDPSGNSSLPGSATFTCTAPPRKHVGFDGRRSAMALDRTGTPHVVYTTDNEILYSRWDAATDEWSEHRIACLCGEDPSSKICLTGCNARWGYRVDLAVDSSTVAGQPIACYVRFDTVPLAACSAGPDPGFEGTLTANLHTVRVLPGDVVIDNIVASDAGSRGCAIETRRGVYSDPASTGALVLREAIAPGSDAVAGQYLHLNADGTVTVVDDTSLGHAVAGSGRSFDVAVDGRDAFWVGAIQVAGPEATPTLIGETPATRAGVEPRFDFHTPRTLTIVEPDGLLSGVPPSFIRVAARGDGEAAVVWTTNSLWLRLAFGTWAPTDTTLTAHFITPTSGQDIPSLRHGWGDTDDNVLRLGGLASAANFYSGIPADVSFADGERAPRIAWLAGTPGETDYHALLHAVPPQGVDPGDPHYQIDVVDGRVEDGAAITLVTSPSGRSRILFHNGLSPAQRTRGSVQFWREEDEDELFRAPTRTPVLRGPARCFASSLVVQDRTGSPHARGAGLDDAFAAITPRPGIDLDPCGRTVDPRLEPEVAYRLVQLLQGAPCVLGICLPATLGLTLPDGVLLPDARPTSRFNRLDGESLADYTARTNEYRSQGFALLRDGIGDLGFLDPVFKRTSDGTSWNSFDPTTAPTDDEFFGSFDPSAGTAHAGALDTVLLELDELSDDLCGLSTTARQSCDGTHGVVAGPALPVCTPTGLRRDPDPFFPGPYYSDPAAPASLDDPYWRFDAFRSDGPDYLSEAGATGDESLAAPGLVAGVTQGLILGGPDTPGVSRDAVDHVCAIRDAAECHGIPALRHTGTVPLTDPGTAPTQNSCPRIREGARFRYPEAASGAFPGNIETLVNGVPLAADIPWNAPVITTPVPCTDAGIDGGRDHSMLIDAGVIDGGFDGARPDGLETVACCTGYHPLNCLTDGDCTAVQRYVEVSEEEISHSVRAVSRCMYGFCQMPSGGATAAPPVGTPEACSATTSGRHGGLPTYTCPCQTVSGSSAIDCDTWAYTCVPDACTPGSEPVYCTDEPAAPSTPALQAEMCTAGAAGDGCRAAIAGIAAAPDAGALHDPLLETLTSMLRGGACSPDTSCVVAPAHRAAPPLGRPLLDHHAVRLATLVGLFAAGPRVGQPNVFRDLLNGLRTALSTIPNLPIDPETISEVRMRWRGRQDGDLSLQGRLEIEMRATPAGLHTDLLGGFTLNPFRIRVAFEPYFYAAPPELAQCDSCGRRQLDETIHLRVVDVGFFRDPDPDVPLASASSLEADTPITGSDIAAGCGCVPTGFNCIAGCGCANITLASHPIRSIDEAPAAVSGAVLDAIVPFEPTLDSGFWFLTSEPIAGGFVMGRLESIDDLRDAPACLPGSPPSPVRVNPDCAADAPPSPGRAHLADTMEALRVVTTRAEVRGRDNDVAALP